MAGGRRGGERGKRWVLAVLLATAAAVGFGRIPLARRLVASAHERLEEGDYAGAEGRYRAAILLAPRLADAHNGLAFSYEMSGRIDEAIRTHERSLALNPDNEIAHVDLGRLYLVRKGMHGRAHECFANAARSNPRSAEARAWHETLHRVVKEYPCPGMPGAPTPETGRGTAPR